MVYIVYVNTVQTPCEESTKIGWALPSFLQYKVSFSLQWERVQMKKKGYKFEYKRSSNGSIEAVNEMRQRIQFSDCKCQEKIQKYAL